MTLAQMQLEPDVICPDCLATDQEGPRCRHCGYYDGLVDHNAIALPPRSVVSGRYFVGLVLGQGGFGITYKGRDLFTRGKVAIKEYFPSQLAGRSVRNQDVTPPTSTREMQYFDLGLQRFREEAEALRGFDHPAIVKIEDYFEGNGTGYLVMPYLEGETLADYLEQQPGRRMPFDVALQVLIRVMDALRQLHTRHLLHRDISPENIYITDDRRRVILLDFGAARYAVGERTHTIVLRHGFTPGEVYRAEKQGPFTDIYGLGATLYWASVGLDSEGQERLPAAPTRERAPDPLVPPSQYGVVISPRAERALLKALAPRPADRYQSIGDFQRDILGEPAEVRTTGTTSNRKAIDPKVTNHQIIEEEQEEHGSVAPNRRWTGLLVATAVIVALILFGLSLN